ncbi:hypothetical protein ACHAWF_000536 [Thalassiosira exigua]
MADGDPGPASEKGRLSLPQLKPSACEGDILPKLQHTLVSVKKMSDAGFYTIFEPGDKGVAVYDTNQVKIQVDRDALLRGWRDASGL